MTRATGSEIALDTNQAIDVLNGRGDSGTWIQSFSRVYVPVPVAGELRFGALNSGKPAANMRKVDTFLRGCTILPITDETTQIYARIRVSLRKKGSPIPANDVWIAALTVEHGIAMATNDSHFNAVDGLSIVSRP